MVGIDAERVADGLNRLAGVFVPGGHTPVVDLMHDTKPMLVHKREARPRRGKFLRTPRRLPGGASSCR
ncbi:hypothetical protein ASE95_10390 [Sphingomonas sp. Leaf231]|nr:hypothetical protein ASE95_10390 [Sphingomonas sp. Leaf231]